MSASEPEDVLATMTAAEVIEHLQMEYLDGEGIWFTLLWRNDSGSAIHALLTPKDFSALHRLREDELWVHTAGATVEMLALHPDGSVQRTLLGRGAGESLHSLVPADSWQGARSRGEWSLVTCVLAPPFSGLELATADTDLSAWPAADEVRGLIRG